MFNTKNKNYWEKLIKEVKEVKEPNRVAETKVNYQISPRHYSQYNLGEPFPTIYLTQREADCVFHLLQGKSMPAIAKDLKLSPRTVEYYLNKIKKKLNCHRNSEIIGKIGQSEFVKNFSNFL
jgi:DNA-binding CsgD family transcriptional regulator